VLFRRLRSASAVDTASREALVGEIAALIDLPVR